ncbi:MAG: type II toxin-antitoxin system VapC family toxin [Acaryochloridaceae cyanobacterium RU_4_10]|nr:type II toxin-antitoxin system VapC family toxin [Acaryochloridaceae cyanobacterium RU_4_10]
MKKSTIANSMFIDTAGWASLFISNEPYHLQAAQYLQTARQQQQTLLTSNYIITELVALLHSPLRRPRPQIFEIVDTIKATPYVKIVHIDTATDLAAWNLCKSRLDKTWSLVDCTSFILMQQFNIRDVLTSDHHFEQAGFTRLLKL